MPHVGSGEGGIESAASPSQGRFRKRVNSLIPEGRAGLAVNLQGNVVPSVTLPVVNPQPGQPTTVTVTTTRYAGDQAQGVVAFQADPQQCAGAGVTSAAVSGSVGVGKAQ